MRVVHIFRIPINGVSGSRNYLIELLTRLVNFLDVELIVEKNKSNKLEELKKSGISINEVKAPKYHSWRYFKEDKWKIIPLIDRYLTKLVKVLQKDEKSIINVHHITYFLPFVFRTRLMYRFPIVVTSHGTGIDEILSDYAPKPFLDDVISSLEKTDAIVSMSKFLKKKIKRLGIKKEKIKVIYPGVDRKMFSPKKFSWKIKEKLGSYVLYFGRLEKEKGVEIVLSTAKHLEDVNFVICGRGSLSNEIKKRIILDRIKNVKFMGFVKKPLLSALIATAQLVMIPSLWDEPFPLAALEAIASGTPIIVSKNGGLPELPKMKGIFFAAGNSPEIYSKIIERNIEIKEKVSQLLRKVSEKYSWENVAKKYVELYKSLTG